MVILTKAQRKALFLVFQRDFPDWVTPTRRYDGKPCPSCGYGGGNMVKVPSTRYRNFRAQVQPGPGCVMLPWKGMWLGIEPDGYTHS
jgi:hypothetical protein